MQTSTSRSRTALAVAATAVGAAALGAVRSRATHRNDLQEALSSAEVELVQQCVSSYRLATNVARSVTANEMAFNLIERIEPDDVASEMIKHVFESTMAIVCATTDLIGRESVSVSHMKAIRTAVGTDATDRGIELYDPDHIHPDAGTEIMLKARRRAESLLDMCERYKRTRGL